MVLSPYAFALDEGVNGTRFNSSLSLLIQSHTLDVYVTTDIKIPTKIVAARQDRRILRSTGK